MGRLTLVIDSHILSDNVDMLAAREANNPHNPLTITNGRVWCHKSAKELIGLGVLSRKDTLLMSVWVIKGNLKEFCARYFHQVMGSSVCRECWNRKEDSTQDMGLPPLGTTAA